MPLGKSPGKANFSDSETNTAYIEAVIPEVQGIVRSPVNYEMVHGTIRTIVGGFSLEDPMTMARTLEELAQTEISDSLAWVSAMKKMADQEDNPKVLTKVISRVRDLTRKEVIDRELGEKLIHQLATNLTTQTLLTEDVPVTRLLERVNQVVTSL